MIRINEEASKADLLGRENERERYSTEQARLEVKWVT